MKKYFPVFVGLLLSAGCSSSNEPIEKAEHKKEKKESVAKEISSPVDIREEELIPEEKQENPPPVEIKFPEAVGIWMVPVEKAKVEGDGWLGIPMPIIFKFDGHYLITQPLFVINGTPSTPIKWLSKDGYYKFKTEWHEDSLFYHSTFGKSEFIAKLTDGKFRNSYLYESGNHIWEYEKITEKDVPEYLRPILKKRTVFNYSLIDKNTAN